MSAWPLLEPGIDPACKFHSAPEPEKLPFKATWEDCPRGWPAGCRRLAAPGTQESLKDAKVDASHDPPRLLVTWACEDEGYTTVAMDADGTPPRWAVGTLDMCPTAAVAVDGPLVMATLTGRVVEDGSDEPPEPPSSIVFSYLPQHGARVLRRLPRGSHVDELVADRSYWGVRNRHNIFLGKIPDDPAVVPGTAEHVELLRLDGDTAVWRTMDPTSNVGAWQGGADAGATFVDARPGNQVWALGVGPQSIVWSESRDCSIAIAKRPLRATEVRRFAFGCSGDYWAVSSHVAAVGLLDGGVGLVRLDEQKAASLAFPGPPRPLPPRVVAVNDREVFAIIAVDRRADVLVRVPVPDEKTMKPLVLQPGRDVTGPDAGIRSDAGAP